MLVVILRQELPVGSISGKSKKKGKKGGSHRGPRNVKCIQGRYTYDEAVYISNQKKIAEEINPLCSNRKTAKRREISSYLAKQMNT